MPCAPLSRALGVAAETWYGWESGQAMPPEILLRVVVDLGVCPAWLLTGDGAMFASGNPGKADAALARASEQPG